MSIRPRLKAWLRRSVVAAGVAYPVVLVVLAAGLGFIGEAWWVTTIGLYGPQFVFALPLPFLAALLWSYRLRRLLVAQVVSALALLVLCGFVMPFPHGGTEGAPKLRVLSLNVDNGHFGYEAVTKEIAKHAPDIVLVQEIVRDSGQFEAMLRAHFAHVQHSTQFIIASRFPILETTEPPRIPYQGRERSPRFLRYRVATTIGELAVYNVHPVSPRGVMNLHRFRNTLHLLRTGELFSGDPESDVVGNAGLRVLQVEATGAMAAREQRPVIVAGDFNLPELSPTFRRAMTGFDDGFRAASWGLGYTFPSRFPWLRLDHVLASGSLRFTAFEVGCKGLSDHRCVVADIERR